MAKEKGLDGKACWDGYKLAGTKKKNGKTVDNCVPINKEENEQNFELYTRLKNKNKRLEAKGQIQKKIIDEAQSVAERVKEIVAQKRAEEMIKKKPSKVVEIDPELNKPVREELQSNLIRKIILEKTKMGYRLERGITKGTGGATPEQARDIHTREASVRGAPKWRSGAYQAALERAASWRKKKETAVSTKPPAPKKEQPEQQPAAKVTPLTPTPAEPKAKVEGPHKSGLQLNRTPAGGPETTSNTNEKKPLKLSSPLPGFNFGAAGQPGGKTDSPVPGTGDTETSATKAKGTPGPKTDTKVPPVTTTKGETPGQQSSNVPGKTGVPAQIDFADDLKKQSKEKALEAISKAKKAQAAAQAQSEVERISRKTKSDAYGLEQAKKVKTPEVNGVDQTPASPSPEDLEAIPKGKPLGTDDLKKRATDNAVSKASREAEKPTPGTVPGKWEEIELTIHGHSAKDAEKADKAIDQLMSSQGLTRREATQKYWDRYAETQLNKGNAK